MTIMPIPLAARALVVSWALTAATALNAIPVAAQPRPKASEPAAGSPVAARAAPLSSPRTRLAPKLITRAALSGALRPSRPPLSSALVISFGASLVLGLLCGGALAATGLPAAGSLAFGLGWAATGMAFSTVAAVGAQLTTSARAATGMGMIVIAITYTLRAVGDLAEPGPSALSW